MNACNTLTLDECFSAIPAMLERTTDLKYLLQQVRISRIRLGSILDRLENIESDEATLERLRDHAECVAYEIECLGMVLRNLSDR